MRFLASLRHLLEGHGQGRGDVLALLLLRRLRPGACPRRRPSGRPRRRAGRRRRPPRRPRSRALLRAAEGAARRSRKSRESESPPDRAPPRPPPKPSKPWKRGLPSASISPRSNCARLLRVAEDLVGRVRLRELVLRLGVVRVAVRVIGLGELAERLLDLRFARGAGHAENVVGVAHCGIHEPSDWELEHRTQKWICTDFHMGKVLHRLQRHVSADRCSSTGLTVIWAKCCPFATPCR